jgi:hypothetical protein
MGQYKYTQPASTIEYDAILIYNGQLPLRMHVGKILTGRVVGHEGFLNISPQCFGVVKLIVSEQHQATYIQHKVYVELFRTIAL